MSALWVFIGGGLGALCRYALAVWIPKPQNDFPLATFMANFISCIVLGAILAYYMHNSDNYRYQLFLVTGFCGGFSTFSSFSAECLILLQNGNYLIAFSYILASLVLCLIGLLIGMKIISFTGH